MEKGHEFPVAQKAARGQLTGAGSLPPHFIWIPELKSQVTKLAWPAEPLSHCTRQMAVHLCECGFGCLIASLPATGKPYSAFNPDSSTVPYVTDFLLLAFGSVIPQLH